MTEQEHERRHNIRLRKAMEEYCLSHDVTAPARRFNGQLRGLVTAVEMAVKHGDMSYDRGVQELLVLGLSPENVVRILGEEK